MHGQTPLHHAILGNYYHTAAYLLENGADPNASNKNGETSLHYAARTDFLQMNQKLKENFLTLKAKGEDAFKRNNYLGAICWYTEAINADPSDATVLSNRSLCWARSNEGSRALSDAEACIALRLDWPKAYYREGVAYKLLKAFVKSAYSFNEALELDPKNPLQKAFWEAVGFVIR
nr:hsp70-Hsp90 organizing protein 3-like isoform X1 [Quercus suber]XP_023915709.1 hsp70-Hsp90 organizing protein 3-like isoform X1 [Quercus suber]XP_023915710.1 hsp70-Hsp90 organizing protein 3-like isoform X1 [Quercus suber]XP_023915711.1 hsp70-Hsp90 organizing protein 3-like isoform X1 [Quercus suber]XP_023915712.1 hsp70-Hsp90 organizing protein 3-like isoform X1 [Quercus suber]XP_023915714.1 hsp70-Hsp90 organizing protein 3-like isoform X1 [Quercus suber]